MSLSAGITTISRYTISWISIDSVFFGARVWFLCCFRVWSALRSTSPRFQVHSTSARLTLATCSFRNHAMSSNWRSSLAFSTRMTTVTRMQVFHTFQACSSARTASRKRSVPLSCCGNRPLVPTKHHSAMLNYAQTILRVQVN
jgi:hypothetical protein